MSSGFLTIIVNSDNEQPARCFAGEVSNQAEFDKFLNETTVNKTQPFKAYMQTGRHGSELVETNS